jgi:hypothetical protein
LLEKPPPNCTGCQRPPPWPDAVARPARRPPAGPQVKAKKDAARKEEGIGGAVGEAELAALEQEFFALTGAEH